ncbi:AbrB/MazE/SpoVT family DNA-binding domain-containing protein [Actinobacillus indolicus]|uniref:AbrB/MazE/SpoVT family DNA-binding domain-containing protein n=1 Tax=Actinobacillus indolicus TaxID=51049 RepID=A0A4V1AY16_9PAST|nr:AbrB/MazE/SpoVT family DNA-binding domain-containing protein [Actinobacillus indolicus]QBQ63800.1 AbrB/MazE/SpoVT family DNA-binding domain-containing protein [Actinobacillus indolicus]
MSVTTAKLFWSGHSQAIRLPKLFRFEGSEVRIEKQGNRLIIEPIVDNWDFLDDLSPVDNAFIEATHNFRQELAQERDWSELE